MTDKEYDLVQQMLDIQEENIILHSRINDAARIIQDAELRTMIDMKNGDLHPKRIIALVDSDKLRRALDVEPSAETRDVFNLIKDMGGVK